MANKTRRCCRSITIIFWRISCKRFIEFVPNDRICRPLCHSALLDLCPGEKLHMHFTPIYILNDFSDPFCAYTMYYPLFSPTYHSDFLNSTSYLRYLILEFCIVHTPQHRFLKLQKKICMCIWYLVYVWLVMFWTLFSITCYCGVYVYYTYQTLMFTSDS